MHFNKHIYSLTYLIVCTLAVLGNVCKTHVWTYLPIDESVGVVTEDLLSKNTMFSSYVIQGILALYVCLPLCIFQ